MDAGRPQPKPLIAVPIELPPADQMAHRPMMPAAEGEKRNRYHIPNRLESASPVGYRRRLSMSREEVEQVLPLLSMTRPTAFAPGEAVTEQELFEESALGVLSSRQSTNFQGFKQVTLGPEGSAKVAALLGDARHLDGPVLEGACHTHIVFCRPYRTPFTTLLTFIGHKTGASLATVPWRAAMKKAVHRDDIPSIGYLVDLHVGILAEAMERAAVIASNGTRRANVIMKPFSDARTRRDNKALHKALCELGGISARDAMVDGWRVALVCQVGHAVEGEALPLSPELARKFGANCLAFRSERIQPGVNQEPKAPAAYQSRQEMDFSDDFVVQCGRAGYNAFTHWTGTDRDTAKHMVMNERVDVLTPGGKGRLREIRGHLGAVTDKVVAGIPTWADLPLGKALSRNAARGKKAFALAGQRIYITGLSKAEVAAADMSWCHAVRAAGAAVARASLYAELMGVMDLPEEADLLAGVCIMAGPVNQNDIGKQFYGEADLLHTAFPKRDPTSLVVWTLKAKTVADPIGNEQQLLDPARKGALVELRAGPHEVCFIRNGELRPLRPEGNTERAFSDQANFARAYDGTPIEGNEGQPWPSGKAGAKVWG